MANILHIQASPRGAESVSAQAAETFVAQYIQEHPDARLETVKLFSADLPPFAAPEAKAKYQVLAGREPADQAARAWKPVIEVIDQLKSADVLVISTGMWNFSIPYRLKQYIDIVVQPGLTFSYDPATGYKGLLTGKKAVLVLARGAAYGPDSGMEGLDMQRPYLQTILGFIGITHISSIVVEPTLQGGPEAARQAMAKAQQQASQLARSL